MAAITQMENERVNRSNNGYKGKRTENGFSPRQNGNKSGANGGGNGYRKPNKPYQAKDGNHSKPAYKKNSQGGYGNYQGGYGKDKDEDDYDRNKKHEPKKRLSVSKEKSKDIQPDKADIAMRFEKEKKIMQKKKQDNKKNNQSQLHQVKFKRSNNIDWTREYENDSYDDDDMSYYY